jgi:hypothetical protein
MKRKLTVLLSTVVVALGLLLGISAAQGADNVVRVFVTGASFFGGFGGLAGADAQCQERAENEGLTGTWTAWLSDSTGNAVDRIPDGQYQLLDGTVIAEDKDDLTSGLLKAPINLNERGEPQGGVVWTGTKPDGTDTGTNCSDWTNAGSPPGGCTAGDDDCGDRGVNSATTDDWTQYTSSPTPCSQAFHLYCFGGESLAPDPVTIGGTVTGLEGSGLILQNNGSDDLPIDADGPFTFATPLAPGDSYNVSVFTQPEGQTCSVTNGSGQVPDVPVTDVTVTCGEPPVSDISKVATEDDTIGGTTLSEILQEGGVTINAFGQVAFHGLTGNTGNTPAVFTQDRLVARKGETLPGTDDFVTRIYDNGGVAINLLGEVAFHGRQLERYEAVFTDQFGVIAQEEFALQGDPSIIPEEISDSGKVAINLFGQVAFHGKIEVGSGLFDKETFQAVFTQYDLIARQGDTLRDNSKIEEINDSGGVAINDLGTVAFHGEVVDPDVGGDTLAAVLTQGGVVAKEGSILGDDIVGEINKDAGVAINFVGDVAFQARVFDPETGVDTVAAVFTQEGVVVKERDILSDGTTVDEISDIGGVAINEFGEVAFHGKTGSTAAVFTQYRVVAKEGDKLADGTTTLDEINDTGGVAINAFGEVAFHGKSNGSDAVFMSGVSLPPSDFPVEAGLFRSITW